MQIMPLDICQSQKHSIVLKYKMIMKGIESPYMYALHSHVKITSELDGGCKVLVIIREYDCTWRRGEGVGGWNYLLCIPCTPSTCTYAFLD